MIVATIKSRLTTVLPANSLRARMAGGAVWVLGGSIASQALAAASSIVVARVLGKVEFGELGMLLGTVGMFNVVAELSMGMTANKHIAQLRSHDPVRAGHILTLATLIASFSGALVTVAVYAFADLLARQALGAPHLAPLLRLSAPMLLLGALRGLQGGALCGFEAFKRLTTGRIAQALATTPLVIGGVLAWGIPGAILGNVVAAAAGCLWMQRLVLSECHRHGIRLGWSGAFAETRVIWAFALPAMLSGLMVTPVIWAANAILVNSPGGYSEFGAFNAAAQWRTLILWAPGAVSEVALPVFAALLADRQGGRFARAVRLNVLVNFVIALAAAIPVMAASYWIMSAYGPGFRESWFVLVVMSAVAVMQSVSAVIGQVIASAGKMWGGFCLNALWAAELLVSTVLLIRLGATGLALAYLVSYALHTAQVFLFTALVLRKHPALGGSAAVAPQYEPTRPEGATSEVVQ